MKPGARGRVAKIALLMVAAVVAGLFGLWRLSKARTFQLFGEIIPRVTTSEPVVALTFDDGPTPRSTAEVLTLLRERGVKATFFVTGRETAENLPQARQIVEAGHELGNHTYSHERMLLKSLAFIRAEVERTDAAIRQAGYRETIHFRPPFGAKLIGLPLYLMRAGRKTIMWDVEPETYPKIGRSAGRIVEHVLERTRPGSIILLHVMYASREESRKALPGIIDGLRRRGYRFVTVSQLLAGHAPG